MRNRFVSFLLLSLIAMFTAYRMTVADEPPSVFHAPDVLANPYAVIAHGGGAIAGRPVTNSVEAVEESVRRGLKAIEIDFTQSGDGALMGLSERARQGGPNASGEAEETAYRAISAQDLNRIFRGNTALVLVTDKTRNYASILETFPFHDRVYVETFNVVQYLRARMGGVTHPMLRIGGSFKWLLSVFIDVFDVRLVTVKMHDVEQDEDYYKALKARGVCPLVSTVNAKEFLARYKDAICAVYSDDLDPPGLPGGHRAAATPQ